MTTEQKETAHTVIRVGADQTTETTTTGTTVGTSARRRRGGRRVVRVAGEAGAKLPVHVQSVHAEAGDVQSASAKAGNVQSASAKAEDVQSASAKAEDVQSAPEKADVASATSAASATPSTPAQPRARKRKAVVEDPDRKARIEQLASEIFTDTGVEDVITEPEAHSAESVVHDAEPVARSTESEAQSAETVAHSDTTPHISDQSETNNGNDIQITQDDFDVVDHANDDNRLPVTEGSVRRSATTVAFSALTHEELQPTPHVRPMTSLLFQEPVLPTRSATRSVRNADEDDTQERTTRNKRSTRAERSNRSERDHMADRSRADRDRADRDQAGRDRLSRADHADRNELHDYDDEFSSDERSSRRRSRNRRLNAQERRAAAEVEHIEEDLQYDEIDYTPIAEDDHDDATYNGEAEEDSVRVRRRRRRRGGHARSQSRDDQELHDSDIENREHDDTHEDDDRDIDSEHGGKHHEDEETRTRRRNRRSGRRHDEDHEADGDEQSITAHHNDDDSSDAHNAGDVDDGTESRRRRRRRSEEDEESTTVTRRRRRRRKNDDTDEEPIRRSRKQQYIDEITDIEGSTRLEAKKQRRRDNRRDRSRQTTLLEQDYLARRENVNRLMVVREKDQHTQISVIEDSILVEHYVSDIQEVATVGNVYLGRVQNVLPSMEAAFVDIGQPRNGVLYAGEVNWDTTRLDGQPRRIELAFKPGDPVLVQVTKDAIGHKGARLTSQVTLAGRFLVLVPSGGMTGVSRKLSERERARLKSIVANIVPENMGVIIRTAAEGASQEAIEKDLAALVRQWEKIQKNEEKARNSKRPQLLKGEPDVAIRVVRDIFNDDFNKLVVEGDKVYDRIQEYLETMAPDLQDKLERWDPEEHHGDDVFDQWRIDSQLRKGMERKVYLPSGGSLVIDRTEAMTTIDVNTGRFIGKGKSLEETVTRCNLEAAEEIARQLRLRDIGGMVMIDFVDMVMPANRDLVLRRLVECLARDRTKHQVAEVTSLGLVQMTRKRVGQGLVEAFSEECPTCKGRGFILHDEPTVSAKYDDPYALKGGDPFIATHKYGYGSDSAKPSREDTAMPQSSSQEVKDKLARIAAAAQAASEERKSQEQGELSE